MFGTFRDELQYIFLEKNFIFMVFLAVKDARELTSLKAMQMRLNLPQLPSKNALMSVNCRSFDRSYKQPYH